MIHFKKSNMKNLAFTLLCLSFFSCQAQSKKDKTTKTPSNKNLEKYATAYFASGCFWCVEAVFESVKGVEEVVSGYSGGKEANPTYEDVSAGITGHAESVKVYYNPEKITYQTLLKVFFDSHDPSTLNRQGPDAGTQYRSMIFYQNENEQKLAQAYINKLLNDKTFSKITTEVVPFKKFYVAEDYHQNYEKNNPGNPYVMRVSIPRLNRFKEKNKALLK